MHACIARLSLHVCMESEIHFSDNCAWLLDGDKEVPFVPPIGLIKQTQRAFHMWELSPGCTSPEQPDSSTNYESYTRQLTRFSADKAF